MFLEIRGSWTELLKEAGNLEQGAWAIVRRAVTDSLERDGRLPAFVINGPIAQGLRAARGKLQAMESRRGLYAAIAALPNRQFEVIVLRFILGYPASKVAWYIGVDERTVGHHIRRGQGATARQAGPACGTEEGKGTVTTIDDLLADAAIPVSDARNFDVGAALRRLAADAAALDPTPGVERATQAGHRLSMVCRWILNEPDAAAHVDKIAQGPDQSPMTEVQMDVDGALVYACLLHLTGHPESAQFWWQLAAGASSRAAAYCLHLDHLRLGELREARHWYHQLMALYARTGVVCRRLRESLRVPVP
ncbi:sigma factor-like helix-turn-helix DNA-binding protein [Streptomyces sp. NPDC056601]|uniref:sigma factor-like helix-turn-helix DNA-binding protein n=1 Tax=Streptomyces sp. NPDC056601 TaxID=3345875 RepID=UPI0036AD2C00